MCLAPPPPPALRTAGKVVIKTLQVFFCLPRAGPLTVDLEKRVEPIVFTGARFQTKAQGYAWPR